MRQRRCFAVLLVPDCERGIRPPGRLLNLETYPIWKTYPILGTYPIKVRQLSAQVEVPKVRDLRVNWDRSNPALGFRWQSAVSLRGPAGKRPSHLGRQNLTIVSSMPVAVRSFAKINLGLRIGAARDDGFHELLTVYQTIGLHDLVKVRIERGAGIEIRCADPRVPTDESNTWFRIAEATLRAFGLKGRVVIEIEKRLPIQGGLGGTAANA